MDSGEINKILGGVIGALLLFLLLGFFGELIYIGPGGHEEEDHVLAFAVPVEEAAGEEEEEEEIVDFAALLADADPAAGERQFAKCQACHSLEEGDNGVGPHLYDVVGRDIASVEGFNYSQTLQDLDGVWDLENLFGFIHNPSEFAPGTKMTFAGLPDNQAKVNLIAFLNQQTDDPTPLQAPEPVVTQLEEEEVAEGTEIATEADVPVVEEPRAESTGSAVKQVPLQREETGEAAAKAAQDELADEDDIDNTATFTEQMTVPEEVPGVEPPAGPVESLPGDQTEDATETLPGSEAPVGPEAVVDEEAETEARTVTNPTTGSTVITEEDRVDPLPEVEEPVEEAIDAEEAEEDVQPEEEAALEEEPDEGADFVHMLAAADVDAGERAFRKCRACHRLEEGQNAVGPHLFGVVGREIASVEGYSYSEALAGKEGAWEPARLDEFLTNPQGWAPGTKMAFAGLKDQEERLNLIAYLQAAGE